MEQNNKLSKLKRIDLRKIWRTENEFTKWLSQEENLSMLSAEMGIEMKLIETEASVGNFSVDILAKEESTGKNIVIENQLEDTNHDHLGKLITYASGYDASVAIWIVKNVREEHRRAIDWLNEHTDEDSNFFLVKIEVWRIADSPFAPKFQIISQPNDWAKAVRKSSSGRELTPLVLKELEFLTGFKDYCQENKTALRLSKPHSSTPGFYTIPIGFSAYLAIKINTTREALRIDVNFTDKELFNRILEEYKRAIEDEIGTALSWDRMLGSKISIVGTYYKNFDIYDNKKWVDYYEWLKHNAEEFQKIFSKYIQKAKK